MDRKSVFGLAGLLAAGMTLTGCQGTGSQSRQPSNAWASQGAAQPGFGPNQQMANAGMPGSPQYAPAGMNPMQASAGQQQQWGTPNASYNNPAGMGNMPTYAAGAGGAAMAAGSQVPGYAGAGGNPAAYGATGANQAAYAAGAGQAYAGAAANAVTPAAGYPANAGGASGNLAPGIVNSTPAGAGMAAQTAGNAYPGMAVQASQVPAGMDQRRQEWQTNVSAGAAAGQQPGYPQAPTPMPGTPVRQPGDMEQ
jgi:hypothetical protein